MARAEVSFEKAPRPDQREIKASKKGSLHSQGKGPWREMAAFAGAAKKWEAFCSEDAEG